MSNVKNQLIRLGNTNPELRGNIKTVISSLEKSAANVIYSFGIGQEKPEEWMVAVACKFRMPMEIQDIQKAFSEASKGLENAVKSIHRTLGRDFETGVMGAPRFHTEGSNIVGEAQMVVVNSEYDRNYDDYLTPIEDINELMEEATGYKYDRNMM